MERLGSLFWSGVALAALLGMLGSIAAPVVLASPVVSIREPSHGQVVEGQIVIDVAYRTDSEEPVTRIDLLIDGDLVRQYSLSTPRLQGTQSFQWDFSSKPGGTYSISARAVDAAGAVGSATISVSVQTARTRTPDRRDGIPPVINIYYPAHGSVVSGEVEIKAEASDDSGVKYVFFYINGRVHKIIMNAPPWVDRWDTTRVPDGKYVLQAKAMDEAENVGRSAEVTVVVQNHDMTLAAPESIEEQVGTTEPRAPAIGTRPPAQTTPVETTPQVTEREFSVEHEQPTLIAARTETEARRAEVGYVSAIREEGAHARTSTPRRIATLPRPERPELTPAGSLTVDADAIRVSEMAADGDAIHEFEIAAIEHSPRITMPRHLPEATSRDITPSTGDAVAFHADRVVLEPAMQLTAEPDVSPGRTTTPIHNLVPSETLVTDQARMSALVLDHEPKSEAGTIAARFEARTTLPARITSEEEQLAVALPRAMDRSTKPLTVAPEFAEPPVRTTPPSYAPVLGRPSAAEVEEAATRIAVLPERASKAAIPVDGRLTRPGEPQIAPVASSTFQDIEIVFNNETLELLAAPELREGISLAPLREIFESSDGVLYWYPIEKRVRATRPGTDMELTIGDPEVTVNDTAHVLQVAPYIKQGRTMVPLQFLADTLDVTVTFNPETGQIRITSNEF